MASLYTTDLLELLQNITDIHFLKPMYVGSSLLYSVSYGQFCSGFDGSMVITVVLT